MKGYRPLRTIKRLATVTRDNATLDLRANDEAQLAASTTIIPFPDEILGGAFPRRLSGGPPSADKVTQAPNLSGWLCVIRIKNLGTGPINLVWGSWPLNSGHPLYADQTTLSISAGDTVEFTDLTLTAAPYHVVVPSGLPVSCEVDRFILNYHQG